jgi:hypothetical protein
MQQEAVIHPKKSMQHIDYNMLLLTRLLPGYFLGFLLAFYRLFSCQFLARFACRFQAQVNGL